MWVILRNPLSILIWDETRICNETLISLCNNSRSQLAWGSHVLEEKTILFTAYVVFFYMLLLLSGLLSVALNDHLLLAAAVCFSSTTTDKKMNRLLKHRSAAVLSMSNWRTSWKIQTYVMVHTIKHCRKKCLFFCLFFIIILFFGSIYTAWSKENSKQEIRWTCISISEMYKERNEISEYLSSEKCGCVTL